MSDIDVELEAETTLKKMGLVPIPQPRMPQSIADIDIDGLTNAELGALYARHIGFAVYMKYKVVVAEVTYRGAKALLDKVEAQLRRQLKAEGVADSNIRDLVHEHEDYQEAQGEVASTYAIHALLTAYMSNYRSQAQALSRLVTLRQLDLEQVRLAPGSTRTRQQRPTRTTLRTAPDPLGDELEDDL